MLYKLLSVSKNKEACVEVNIGDYIQALASSQYYPHIDGFLDRDEDLKDYDGEPCKIIMNGWYMHNPKNWPPSNKIIPLFVAFHLNVLAKKELTSPESISYLKMHEPIGCRDIRTMNTLKNKGIDAYFSGCMTLTLGKKYHSSIKDDRTYIVDPILGDHIGIKDKLMSIFHFMKYPGDIIKLSKEEGLSINSGRNKLKNLLKISLFHKEYSKLFSRKLIMNSTYICQQNKYYKENFKTEEERLIEAENIIKQYAKAKLVITSRIHCALPCLGLETPVIYLRKEKDTEASSCRLDGLADLFNIVSVKNNTLVQEFKANLHDGEIPINKTNWKELAESLNEQCNRFITEE